MTTCRDRDLRPGEVHQVLMLVGEGETVNGHVLLGTTRLGCNIIGPKDVQTPADMLANTVKLLRDTAERIELEGI